MLPGVFKNRFVHYDLEQLQFSRGALVFFLLSQTQLAPLTALLQVNFYYQQQASVVSPDAHPSSYSSVAIILIQPMYLKELAMKRPKLLAPSVMSRVY